MHIKSFLTALSFASLAATAAGAADIVKHITPTPPHTAFSFAGPYIGAETGVVASHFYDAARKPSPVSEIEKWLGRPKDTPLVGIFAGYNIALGQHAILGLDGNIDFHHSEAQKLEITGDPSFDFYTKYKENALAAARIRLGYAQGLLMPYIAGGIEVVHSGFISGTLSEGIANPKKHARYHKGWNIGAGVDYAVTNHIFLRADYRFSQVKIHNYTTLEGNDVKEADPYIGLKSHQLRIGAAYKF